ncbi:hypothetical protein VKT23_016914 [Stygiomarasmius scandens]|uniref:Uncharacterized protein n=1 Tax=Marasmiellus scandens TaxID=2682957 RepID=A0ABR1IT62_9AGAR
MKPNFLPLHHLSLILLPFPNVTEHSSNSSLDKSGLVILLPYLQYLHDQLWFRTGEERTNPLGRPRNVGLGEVNGRTEVEAKLKAKTKVDLKDPNFPRIVGGDEGLALEGLEEFKEMGSSVRARIELGLNSDSDSDSEESYSSDGEDYDMDYEEDKIRMI